MRILVINGSPKGINSITLQSMKYLEKIEKENTFSYINIGPMLKKIEKNPEIATEEIESADLIIFSYPVYTFLAPYCVHRFIEILKEMKIRWQNKWATEYTTSKHFYDTTAHRFVMENLLDLGFKFIPSLSQDMEDLTKEEGRRELIAWRKMSAIKIERGIYTSREKEREEVIREYKRSITDKEKSVKGKVSIVTNASLDDESLLNMIEDFRASLPIESCIYNLNDFKFSGPCLGCFACAKDGKCIHKDHFDDFLRNEIQRTSSIVYAFRIKNHFTGSIMKCYDDRQFCNGHRAVTAGTPTLYIIAGDLEKEENLKDLIEARASVGGNYLASIVTDEKEETAKDIENAAYLLSYAIENNITEPRNFFGVGGNKIFRDLIYEMRGLMRADHEFYKKHGYYKDLPNRQKKRIIMMKFVGLLLSLPSDKKAAMMNKGMLSPYEKVLKDADKE